MDIPNKKKSVFSLENAVFYISLLLLAAVVGGFFYLGHLITQKEGELAEASVQAARIKTEEQKKLEDRILLVRQKLDDFSKILADRKISTGFFNKLESAVLPEVYFSDCKLDLDKMTAGLSGHADNFQALGQQMMLFENSKNNIKKANLGKVDINKEGGIDFDVSFEVASGMAVSK
ncbi:MAG: hypothetical protein WA093_01820 [Minisyncoccales bacterium]